MKAVLDIAVQNGGAAGVTTVTPLAPCTNGAQAAEVVTPTPAAAGVQAGQTPGVPREPFLVLLQALEESFKTAKQKFEIRKSDCFAGSFA